MTSNTHGYDTSVLPNTLNVYWDMDVAIGLIATLWWLIYTLILLVYKLSQSSSYIASAYILSA